MEREDRKEASRVNIPPTLEIKLSLGTPRGGEEFPSVRSFFKRGCKSLARKKETIKREVIKNMKELGTYKKEYRTTIDIFVDMVHQYEVFTEEFEEKGYQIQEEYTNKAGATNMRKTPIYSAMEKLRMDISTYSNLLCLNPKSLENVTAEKQNKSKLAEALNKLE